MEGPVEEIRPNVWWQLEIIFLHNWNLSSYVIIFTVKQLWTPLTSSLLQNDCYKFPLYLKECSRAKHCSTPLFLWLLFSLSPKAASQVLRMCKSVTLVNMTTSTMTGLCMLFPQVCRTNEVSYHQWSLFSENCCVIKHLHVSANEEWDTQVQGHGRGVREVNVFLK